MTALAILALALGQFPPQNQPVNITQVKGTSIGDTNAVPVKCVSGCGGGSGGGAVDQGEPGPTDGGWPVVLVDNSGNYLGTSLHPIFVSGGGGGGGASWDAGVIVQFPVAIASLWDGGVEVLNFPAVQAVSQEGVWVVDLDPDAGVIVESLPPVTQGSIPWITTLDPDAGPIPVTCVSGCGGGSGGGGASWDAGVVVQNFPASFGASQTGNWSVLLEYDGGALPVSGTVVADQGTDPWTVTGTVEVLQGTVPWATLAPPDWDAGVEVLNWPAAFGATQSGNWAELMIYDGGPLPISGTVAVSGSVAVTGTVAVSNFPATQAVTQSGNWSVLMEYDGGALPVSGTVSVSNFPAFPTVQAVSIVDGGPPTAWDAGYLAYTYAGPLPADTSYQTSCTMASVLCGTTATSLGTCTGGKWQDFQNQSTQSIYICPVAGCSAPSAIDAGTTVGEQVQPFATYFANGSAAYWCVVPTSPQVSPDAGTVVKCCK